MRTVGLITLLVVVSPRPAAPAQQTPSVTLERVADDRWRATFRLTAPATSLRFDRDAAFYRERVWQIATPGYHFARQSDQQYVMLDSGNLFSFWRALIADAGARGAYDEASYFSTLAAFGVADSTIARMRSFLVSRDRADLMIAGLESAGIAVHSGRDGPPPAYQRELTDAVMIHLMRQACGRVDFTSGPPIRTAAVQGCAPFASEMQVYRIEDYRVRDQGAALYDAVRAACETKQGIALQGKDGVALVTVACTEALAAPTPWYELDEMTPRAEHRLGPHHPLAVTRPGPSRSSAGSACIPCA